MQPGARKITDVISKSGVAVPYQHTLKQMNRIAEAVQQNIYDNGTYIPPGFV
jgi:hypothetical protein